MKVGGVEHQFDPEITEQHPDERVAGESAGGDGNRAGVITFHLLSDSASVKVDLKNFTTFIEKQGSGQGAWRCDVGNWTAPATALQDLDSR